LHRPFGLGRPGIHFDAGRGFGHDDAGEGAVQGTGAGDSLIRGAARLSGAIP
jgi:hypothetical protein